MTRVLVVAASDLSRAGLKAVIAGAGDIQVAGAVRSLDQTELSGAATAYDVVLLDWNGEDELPLDAIGSAEGAPAVVVLAEEFRVDALRPGVNAVLPRDIAEPELWAAIRAAAAGLVVLHPADAARLVPAAVRHEQEISTAAADNLTERERQVLRMVADGSGNKEIAWRLGISEHTVKFHVAAIMGKLHAGTRTEAVTIGIRRGLVPL